MHDKWPPTESVHMIVLPAETLGRKHIHAGSLDRNPIFNDSSPGRKQAIEDSLGGRQIWRTV